MNCIESEPHLSALYDGEAVPPAVAQHVAACPHCRRILSDHSQMSAELRLVAAMESARLPPLKLTPRRNPLQFLWQRIAIPRFALALLLAALVALPVSVSLLRSQSHPLWFQFGYSFAENHAPPQYTVARAGYDHAQSTISWVNGAPVYAAIRLKIESISPEDVILRCRAILPEVQKTASRTAIIGVPKSSISLDNTPEIHYKPGDSLPVPIEGGGTIYLKGEVFDHQPKIAFGYPLEPHPGTLLVRAPVLVEAHQLLAQQYGATASTGSLGEEITVHAGLNGTFHFALRPFPGAVSGKAEWGQIEFTLHGEEYRLLAPAPITDGDQPVAVWVRRDPATSDGISLGSGPIPQ